MGILCLRDACPQYGARMTVTFQKKMLVGRASKLDGDGEGSSMRQLQVRFQGSRWSSKWDCVPFAIKSTETRRRTAEWAFHTISRIPKRGVKA